MLEIIWKKKNISRCLYCILFLAPNGAGKTTSAESMLPGVLNCIEFVNADFIARGIFIWLNHPDIAKERVKQRVEKGGHSIPEDVIERRYIKGIKNLNKIFLPSTNEWIIADNSGDEMDVVAQKDEFAITVFDQHKYKIICHD